MRALGLDIGSVRVGVAVSDPDGAVASAVAVLDARELAHDVRVLARIAEDYEVEQLVVGLPLTLSGTRVLRPPRSARLPGGLRVRSTSRWHSRTSAIRAVRPAARCEPRG